MSRVSLKIAIAFLCALLAACGGGGGDSTSSTSNNQTGNGSGSPQAGSPVAGDTGGQGVTTTPSSPVGTGGSTTPSGDAAPGSTPPASGSTPPAESFTAAVMTAPSDGSALSSIVRLEVRGTAIENAELLPPVGYSPRLGMFTVSADKTAASLDFDTRTLPNGTLLARISAFNRPAGSADAAELVAMPTRTWLLRNDPPPVPTQIPSASYMPEVHISGLNLPYVDPQPLRTMMALDDAAYESMLANDWPRVEGVLHQYIPPHVVLMPPTPMGFSGPWYSCLDFHMRLACREAMNAMIGLMVSKQPSAPTGG